MAQKKSVTKKKTAVKKAVKSSKTPAKKTTSKKSAVVSKAKVRNVKKTAVKKAGPAKKSSPGKTVVRKKAVKQIIPTVAEALPEKYVEEMCRCITARKAGLGPVIAKITDTKTKSAPKRQIPLKG